MAAPVQLLAVRWTLCIFAGLGTLATAAPPVTGPAGAAMLQVRLLTSVSTYRSKPGTAIVAEVVSSDGQVPSGAVVRGQVARVKKVGLGLVHESATLELKFQELTLPDGSWYPLDSRVVDVDNARERVDRHGAIHGLRATDSLSHRFGARIAFAALGHPLFMIPAFAVESGLFRFPDPEIEYGPGTELNLEAHLPEMLEAEPPVESKAPDAYESTELRQVVDDLPYWSFSKRQRQPMDLVNLVFIGSREELERAFAAAGWDGAQPNSMMGGFKAIRAVVEDRKFARAPMRTLLLDGEEPDLTRQKTLNTFDKRHHLRIWKRPEEWAGRTIWAAAATQDIATTFSMRPFGFTHEIEKDVDHERDKVVGDLVFTGCVDQAVSVRRPEPVRDSEGYRKGVQTDSRVAVLVLDSCETPRLDLSGTVAASQPSAWVRFTRRVILTAKNHFIRDNLIWRSGDVAWMGIRAARNWHAERRHDQRIEAAPVERGQDIKILAVR
jgi:hypothetical protein